MVRHVSCVDFSRVCHGLHASAAIFDWLGVLVMFVVIGCLVILFSLLTQLENERKAREEQEKRDAEEAAERQRREEEWVRKRFFIITTPVLRIL